MIPLLIAVGASVAFVLLALPVFASLAKRYGLVDHPDKQRKLHESAIPLVGGITVACGSIVAFLMATWMGGVEMDRADVLEYVGLLLGGLTILLVGVVDDRFGLRGRQKLIGQVIAATILIGFGFRFHYVAFASLTIDFGIFWVLVVYIWILAAINSVNLLDGADGFASTVGIVMFTALSVMAAYGGDFIDAVMCAAFAGALVGFLRYNFPPAKAFLGDAGSMLIGFVLAAITIRCQFKQATAYAFFAPIALLAIPLIDTAAAILRRRLTGRSIYATDRGHLHHAMAKKGLGPRTSLLWVAFLTTTTATGGILSLFTKHSEFAILSIGIVICVLVIGRIFGVAEFELLSRKAFGIAGSFLKSPNGHKVRQSTVQLQGHRDWQAIWVQLCQFADENHLHEITLDVNAPWIHESFHATRRLTQGKHDVHEEWQSALPLIVDGRIFGRISFTAPVAGQFTHQEVISNVVKISSDVELVMVEITKEDLEQRAAQTKVADKSDSDELEVDSSITATP